MVLTRRQFLKLGVSAGAAAAVGITIPAVLTRRTDERVAEFDFFPRVKVGRLSRISVGEPVAFEYPLEGQTNVLVKLGVPATRGVGPDQDIVAFSNICTHMGCTLQEYRHDWKVLGPCPCHFSTFDLSRNGIPTLGQATENLPQVLLSAEGDDIFATGVLRLVAGYAGTLEGSPPVAETTS